MTRTIQRPYVIGMDISGTITRFGVVDARGNIVVSDSVETRSYPELNDFVSAVCRKLEVLLEKCGGPMKIKAMGVGAPNANYYTRQIERAMNLPWKGMLPLAALLQDQLGITVGLTNNANATAIGEMSYGGARGMKNFVEVTIGNGVGGGIVLNGQLIYGADGNAGEIGHICVRPGGRQCSCGLRGCLESYCSARGVIMTFGELLEQCDEPCSLRGCDLSKLASSDLYLAAVAGDALCRKVFYQTGRILGEGLAQVVNTFSPEAIILQGGMVNAGDFLLDATQESLDEHVMPVFRNKVKLAVSELDRGDAAILGSAAFAWDLKEYQLYI